MALRRVDPSARHGRAFDVAQRFARSAVGRWYGIHIAAPLDAGLLRATGGRIRLVGPLPTAVLLTIGARSGQARATPVVYFHDNDDVILIASSFGRERHPGWFHNLVAHPHVTLNAEPYVATEVPPGDDYERLFELATRVYAGYADYRIRAARSGRRIPVLRLTPEG